MTTTISDPAPCTDEYSHVWVTIQDVEAHTSPDATTGFSDLTPKLPANPIQVDLLAPETTECILATLGDNVGLTAGKYQQIRLEFLPNEAPAEGVTPPSPNECAAAGTNVFNCVVTTGGTFALSTPSGTEKIPPGQLTPGGLTVPAGESVDIDIDFNACASVVQAGKSGNFNLKPTLRAFELGTNPLIEGSVVEATVSDGSVTPSSTTVANANVWLEQQETPFAIGTPSAAPTPSTEQVENLIQQTTTDSSGNFEFCPVGAGDYEIVTDAPMLSSSEPSAATISTGVSVTSSGGPSGLVIPVVQQGSSTVSAAVGQITTQASSTPGSGDDVALAGTQPFTGLSGPVQALVPFFSSATLPVPPTVLTSATPGSSDCPTNTSLATCPAGTNCACFTLALPSSNPVIGIANTTGDGYAPPSSPPVDYSIAGTATVPPPSSPTLDCTNPMLITQPFAFPTPGPGAPTLSFTGCD